MATKKVPARVDIENIKTNLRTIATSTATTISDLQYLLAEQSEDYVQKENLGVKSSRLNIAQSAARRKAVVAAATKTEDAGKQKKDSLMPREKYILATEVINITLKSLADALKSQPPLPVPQPCSTPNAPPIDEMCAPSKQRSARSKTSFEDSHPLQERSVSQIINSPKKPSLARPTSSSSFLTNGPDAGLLATAECARIAFTYLRSTEGVKVAGKDSPKLQLENGILAFIGKLVAHGLDNIAIKELRILKRRLDHFLGTKTDNVSQVARRTNSKVEHKNPPISTEKETLASLLDFGNVDQECRALPLITSHQTYTLRVIARINRPRIVEAAWEHLKISNPTSPVNLIWHTAKVPSLQMKATRQLESLAQTILSLCPSISSSDDLAVGDDQVQPLPDIVFRLQHLAFQIKKKWWSLAKHEGNEEKELFEPFSKCLLAFSRRSKLSAPKKYKLAELLYMDICGPVNGTLPSGQSKSAILQAAQSLSTLAQAAGLTDEALRWIGISASPDTSKASVARATTRIVRIATLSLDAAIKDGLDPRLNDAIISALDALSGSVGGSASDLDCLFLEANALRRMACKALTTGASTIKIRSEASSLQDQALRVIAASVHFSVRYIGTQLPADMSAKDLLLYNERLFKASRFVKSIVDSIITCCKQAIDLDARWTALDGLIQDGIRIVEHFDHQGTAPGKDFFEDLQYPFVKLSNAYWAVYLQLRKADGAAELIVKAMERSIELLQCRTQTERQSGLLAMKLEKLGEALDYLDRIQSSRSAFLRCLHNLVEGDIILEVIEAAARLPIQQVFEEGRNAASLGRVLKSYHRSFIKDGWKDSDDWAFFDTTDLPAAARGAVLEWQLGLYLKSLARGRPWNPTLTSSVREMAERMLEIYSSTVFPIRRQRLHIQLFQLAQAHPDILSQEMLQSAKEPNHSISPSQTDDSDLERYADHLGALLKIKLCMRDATPSVPIFQQCLSVWQSLVDSAPTWRNLVLRIDEPQDWIDQIQAIADYLAAKGEEYASLPALHLLVKILELENDSNPSRLIISCCTLGLQLLELGYTGKAGLAFAKAEALLSSDATSTDAKLRWHIGYAEYLVRIGNTLKW